MTITERLRELADDVEDSAAEKIRVLADDFEGKVLVKPEVYTSDDSMDTHASIPYKLTFLVGEALCDEPHTALVAIADLQEKLDRS